MDNFLAELRRRNVFRVGAAYAVVAWMLLQVVNNLTPALRLPDWASSLVVVLLMVGFPVVMIFTWAHELPPETATTSPAANSKLDWFLSSALVVVFALVTYQQLAPARSDETPRVEGPSLPGPQAGAISVAVLPFVNLSSDPEQEFFSDGMTEEITSALAKVPGLIVIGRTSAFEFKGQNKDLRAIGQALGTTHLIEGSVRKNGPRVRITAQLIVADSGAHLWTENYERELTDIFAIQEGIATAIATSLRVPLGLKPGENLVNNRTKNQASYEDYLRAKALVHSRGFQSINAAAKLLEASVARDPDFAPAWGYLATAYRLVPLYDPVRLSGGTNEARLTVETSLAKAQTAAERAIQLDPTHSDGYDASAAVERMRRNYISGVDLYLKALALDSNNPDVLHSYSITLAELGYLKQAVPLRERLLALEPYVPVFHTSSATILWASGRTDAAIAMYKSPAAREPGVGLAMVYASQGHHVEAADLLQSLRGDTAVRADQLQAAARLLRSASAATAPPQELPALGVSGWVYLYAGEPERVLEYHEGNLKIGYHGGIDIIPLWAPSNAPIRKTQRFKDFVRAAGYFDYWRARGWPDQCRAVGADDFACD